MKKVYVLCANYGYDGYGFPEVAWDHMPSKKEIYDYLISRYQSDTPQYGHATVEETNAYLARKLQCNIENGEWEITECEVMS
jgi:hypothetical protein